MLMVDWPREETEANDRFWKVGGHPDAGDLPLKGGPHRNVDYCVQLLFFLAHHVIVCLLSPWPAFHQKAE